MSLRTPAAYYAFLHAASAWTYASAAWGNARYAYTVDARYWGLAASNAAACYQHSYAAHLYLPGYNPYAYAASVYAYRGWVYASAARSYP